MRHLFSYCPSCAMPLDDHSPSRQECRACGRVWYHNSAPCVGGLPLDTEGRVLLGKRGIEPFYGSWNVIGGFLQYGEDPFAGLRREVREELGVECDIVDFVTMAPDTYGPSGQALLNIYFTVRLHSMEVAPHDDVMETQWFSLERLPKDIAFASDRKALEMCKRRLSAGGAGAGRTYCFSGP